MSGAIPLLPIHGFSVVDRENLVLYVFHVEVRLVNCVLCAQKVLGCGATIEMKFCDILNNI